MTLVDIMLLYLIVPVSVFSLLFSAEFVPIKIEDDRENDR